MFSTCNSFSSASAALAPASLAPASSTSNGVFTAPASLTGFVGFVPPGFRAEYELQWVGDRYVRNQVLYKDGASLDEDDYYGTRFRMNSTCSQLEEWSDIDLDSESSASETDSQFDFDGCYCDCGIVGCMGHLWHNNEPCMDLRRFYSDIHWEQLEEYREFNRHNDIDCEMCEKAFREGIIFNCPCGEHCVDGDNCPSDCWCENCQLCWEDRLEELADSFSDYTHLKSVDFPVDNKRVQGKSGTRTFNKPNKASRYIKTMEQLREEKCAQSRAKAVRVSKAKLLRPSKQDQAADFVGAVRDLTEEAQAAELNNFCKMIREKEAAENALFETQYSAIVIKSPHLETPSESEPYTIPEWKILQNWANDARMARRGDLEFLLDLEIRLQYHKISNEEARSLLEAVYPWREYCHDLELRDLAEDIYQKAMFAQVAEDVAARQTDENDLAKMYDLNRKDQAFYNAYGDFIDAPVSKAKSKAKTPKTKSSKAKTKSNGFKAVRITPPTEKELARAESNAKAVRCSKAKLHRQTKQDCVQNAYSEATDATMSQDQADQADQADDDRLSNREDWDDHPELYRTDDELRDEAHSIEDWRHGPR